MRRSDRHQRRLSEKEGKRVLVVRSGQRDAAVRDPAGGAEKRGCENAAVGGKVAAGHVREEMESMVPGGPNPEGMQKSEQSGRVGAGRQGPVQRVRRKWEDTRAVPVSAVTGLVQVHRTGPVPFHRLTPTLYPASLLVLVAGQRLL